MARFSNGNSILLFHQPTACAAYFVWSESHAEPVPLCRIDNEKYGKYGNECPIYSANVVRRSIEMQTNTVHALEWITGECHVVSYSIFIFVSLLVICFCSFLGFVRCVTLPMIIIIIHTFTLHQLPHAFTRVPHVFRFEWKSTTTNVFMCTTFSSLCRSWGVRKKYNR